MSKYTFDDFWKQPISKEIFNKKYNLHNETEEQFFNNIANEVASVEKDKFRDLWKNKFYEIISSAKFIPAGRILANARTFSKLKNYNNCFTIEINDDMQEIYKGLAEDAQISKMGGGVGFNISKLRPEGDILTRGGEASGPLSFLRVFNESAKIIMTGGQRRSAHIAVMNVDHPDIEKFITVKQGDKNKELTQFNISVGLTDAFMKAVKKDEDWDLKFNDKIYKTVRAKDLYEKIVGNAFEHNEPGIFNLDTVNKYNNGWYLYNIQEVNPCFTGDTLVATADGRNQVPIKQLAEEGKDIPVYAKDGKDTVIKTMRNPRVTGYNEDIYKITLDDGGEIKCTKNHKFLMKNGTYKRADELSKDDSMNVSVKFKTTMEEIFKESKSMINNPNFIKSMEKIRDKNLLEKQQLTDLKCFRDDNGVIVVEKICEGCGSSFTTPFNRREVAYCSHSCYLQNSDHLNKMRAKNHDNAQKRKNNTKEKIINLFTEFVDKNVKIPNKDEFINILNNNGINDLRTAGFKGSYYTFINSIMQSYKVSPISSRALTYNTNNCKQEKAEELIDNGLVYNHKVVSVEYIGKENVYNGTVDDVHNFDTIFNTTTTKSGRTKLLSCNSLQCGEQPIPPYNVCDLGSLNLTKFIEDPFGENAHFNFTEFEKVIYTSVRFLDNVLDATDYPLEKIKEQAQSNRRIGLGFTGLADAMVMLNIKYGSIESKDLSEKIAKALRDYSYNASIELAKEKGPFPNYDEKYLESKFVKKLHQETQNEIEDHGIRNISLNTVAPTGCLTKENKIKTSEGIKTVEEIFKENSVKLKDEIDSENKWIIPVKNLNVETLDGYKRINKLYINGMKETRKIKTENSKIEATNNHMVLVKIGENKAAWKRLDELSINDKILIKK